MFFEKAELTFKCFLAVLATGASTVVFAASGKEALLDFSANTQSAAGKFEQTVKDSDGNIVQGGRSSGTFAFARPGRFAWNTVKPYPQEIVSDAKTIYIWDPDLNQVTVKRLTEAIASTPASLLFGTGDLEKNFSLQECGSKDGLEWVAAEPRTEDLSYRRVEIGFDGAGRLAAMKLMDHFGQTTELHFSEVRFGGKVDTSVFNFRIPEEADIIRDEN